MKPRVLIIMGSDSDLKVMEGAARILEELNIPYHMTLSSAHRTPERTQKIIRDAERSGIEVIIAGAGMAAHLAGVIASHTLIPVIGVPIDSSSLNGMDALLSTVQMPPGVPVATMSIGSAGARNAALFAAQILALRDPEIKKALISYRKKMQRSVIDKAQEIETRKGHSSNG
jgi:phosphoribosylaminoimidazole carboxylase PurE protein